MSFTSRGQNCQSVQLLELSYLGVGKLSNDYFLQKGGSAKLGKGMNAIIEYESREKPDLQGTGPCSLYL